MGQKELSSRQQETLSLLSLLTGHLKATSEKEQKDVEALQEKLINVLVNENIATLKNSFYSVDNSDLYFDDVIPQARQERMKTLVGKFPTTAKANQERVFVREVPVRTSQIKGSLPTWANGAAIEKTVGPLQSVDGRYLWFDFYTIEKLIALYIDGDPNPAILFNVSMKLRYLNPSLPPTVDPSTEYTLLPDSVWIASKYIAANSPAGMYTGIKIKQGKIILNQLPRIVNAKLSITTSTILKVTLDLSPENVTDADPTSPYGVDPRAANINLPKSIAFHFSANNTKIDEISGDIVWGIYGKKYGFKWIPTGSPNFEPLLSRISIPYKCVEPSFTIKKCLSPFEMLASEAKIKSSAWSLSCGQIDVTKPAPAKGIGGVAINCSKGLKAKWNGLNGGEANLTTPQIIGDPEAIVVLDFHAGNHYCNQQYQLWTDQENPYGSTLKVQYTEDFPIFYISHVNGTEVLDVIGNTNPLLDRPVTVSGNKLDIQSKNSTLLTSVSKNKKLLYVYDENILFDNFNPQTKKNPILTPIAFALHNALFKTTSVNGLVLFGELADDLIRIAKGFLFLTFGIYAYLPTLPDPYAANIGNLGRQLQRTIRATNYTESTATQSQTLLMWLICQINWEKIDETKDNVTTSFHFAPLQNQFLNLLQNTNQTTNTQPVEATALKAEVITNNFVNMFKIQDLAKIEVSTTAKTTEKTPTVKTLIMAKQAPNYQKQWDNQFSALQKEVFALLDVSSNADQIGVSYAQFGSTRMAMVQTYKAETISATTTEQGDQFPLKIDGLDVTTTGSNARLFALPQVSWEPLLSPIQVDPVDPATPIYYYPDDGGPTRVFNNSTKPVALSPIPMSDFLINSYAQEPTNFTVASFTLPFGIRSVALLYKFNQEQKNKKPNIKFNRPLFKERITGCIQFQLDAGDGISPFESESFRGYTLQMNNVLDLEGNKTNGTTLGFDVSYIFNGDFFHPSDPLDWRTGVPVTRIDLSGFGESLASNWINKNARFASTSQAKFDVFTGRASHEVIQVKSMLYPWGIKVVRTITIFRVGSGYVYRLDSGWKAESDGRFDFSFKYAETLNEDEDKQGWPYEIHPGLIKGLFNVRNIRSALADVTPFSSSMDLKDFFEYTVQKKIVRVANVSKNVDFYLQPVYFDADVEIENVIQGQVGGRVPSSKILGFVQLAPRGIPLTPYALQALLARQFGSIAGPIDCIVDIGKNAQKMRINAFDVSNSIDRTNTKPIFVAAIRGNVILPKEGSWSVVAHEYSTGNVTPLPESVTVPLIRVGQLDKDLNLQGAEEILRIANPTELLRTAIEGTINYGFLQSTNTQKLLILTPSFQNLLNDLTPGKLLSKTPPLFADAYHLMNSKGIFPNIGNAIDNFGDAVNLLSAFNPSSILDGGKQVLELMHINAVDNVTCLAEDGYKLLNKIENFDLSSGEWYLINESYLKLYIKYTADTQNQSKEDSITNRLGSLDFNIDSYANNLKDKWLSRINNLSMVVDMGPFSPLLTVKGNFDAKKGHEASFTGSDEIDTTTGVKEFPTAQLEARSSSKNR